MEFPSAIAGGDEGDDEDDRACWRSTTRWFEWSLREGGGDDDENDAERNEEGEDADRRTAETMAPPPPTTTTTTTMNGSPLVGTNWRAVEVTFPNAATTTALPSLSSDDHGGRPLTISFEARGHVSGSAGCNRYHGSASFSSSSSSPRRDEGDGDDGGGGDWLQLGGLGVTHMACHGPPEGIMERERDYLALLSGGQFFYEIIAEESAEEEGGEEEDGVGGRPPPQLVLTASTTRSKDRLVPGQVVARFVPYSDPSGGV